MWIFRILTFSSILVYHIVSGEGAIPPTGPCYSRAQVVCEHDMANFWAAVIKNDKNNVCRYLKAVQACVQEAMSMCDYKQHELELYEKDIIHTFTQNLYNCELDKTKIKVHHSSPHKGSSGAGSIPSSLYLMALLQLVLCKLRL